MLKLVYTTAFFVSIYVNYESRINARTKIEKKKSKFFAHKLNKNVADYGSNYTVEGTGLLYEMGGKTLGLQMDGDTVSFIELFGRFCILSISI